jgi:hypothetical protein
MTSPPQDSFSRLMNWLSSKDADRPEAPTSVANGDRQEPTSGRQDDPFSRLMNHISSQG